MVIKGQTYRAKARRGWRFVRIDQVRGAQTETPYAHAQVAGAHWNGEGCRTMSIPCLTGGKTADEWHAIAQEIETALSGLRIPEEEVAP